MKNKSYIIEKKDETLRLDKVLSLFENDYSRAYISNLIKQNNVTVNGEFESPSYKVKVGDLIEVNFEEKESNMDLEPLNLKLDIIYEDDDLIVINKPAGLVVHPGSGHQNDTLVNALIYNKKQLSTINGLNRIGIVHRIDKDTSGLLLICKNDYIHNQIAEQLKDHSMHREYIALVDGVIPDNEGKIIGKIGRDKQNRLKMAIDNQNGKDAVTRFTVEKRFNKYTLVRLKLETGRTHQIRVHMSSIGFPVTGDKLYGGSTYLYKNGQLLHAYQLTFYHPILKKEMSFKCDIPQYFKEIIDKLD
ncbi:MAG: RluA family pseudouridine synthase [Bacilli bacterium]|nr:RluA family pseudouridine synthase [Bacilli bacterium]